MPPSVRPRVGLGPRAVPWVLAGEAAMVLVLWWDLGYPSFAKLMANLTGHGEWVLVLGSGAGFGVSLYLAVELVRNHRRTRRDLDKRRAARVEALMK